MLNNLELVEIKLEHARGTRLSGGGTALVFQRGAKTRFGCCGGTATPRMVHCPSMSGAKSIVI
jgi:hypothetical protein